MTLQISRVLLMPVDINFIVNTFADILTGANCIIYTIPHTSGPECSRVRHAHRLHIAICVGNVTHVSFLFSRLQVGCIYISHGHFEYGRSLRRPHPERRTMGNFQR